MIDRPPKVTKNFVPFSLACLSQVFLSDAFQTGIPTGPCMISARYMRSYSIAPRPGGKLPQFSTQTIPYTIKEVETRRLRISLQFLDPSASHLAPGRSHEQEPC